MSPNLVTASVLRGQRAVIVGQINTLLREKNLLTEAILRLSTGEDVGLVQARLDADRRPK